MAVNIKPASKSKMPLILGAVVVIVLLLGGVYFMKFKSGTSMLTGGNPMTGSSEGGIIGNLKDAIMAGQSMKCTYTTDEGQTTVYTKGKKVRMEGSGFMGSEGGQGSGGMITDGLYTYMWNDIDKKGMKFKVQEPKVETSESQVQEDQSDNSITREDFSDMEKWAEEATGKFDVKCSPFSVPDSMFVPPSDITWQDMDQWQKEMEEYTEKFKEEGYDQQGLEELMKQIPEGMGQQ